MTPFSVSAQGGLVGRLGRTTRKPGADSEKEINKKFMMSSIFKASQKYFLKHGRNQNQCGEDAPRHGCKLCRRGTFSKQILHPPPGRAGSNGREIHLRQLHPTVCFDYLFHAAKLQKKNDTTKIFVKKKSIKLQ